METDSHDEAGRYRNEACSCLQDPGLMLLSSSLMIHAIARVQQVQNTAD